MNQLKNTRPNPNACSRHCCQNVGFVGGVNSALRAAFDTLHTIKIISILAHSFFQRGGRALNTYTSVRQPNTRFSRFFSLTESKLDKLRCFRQ